MKSEEIFVNVVAREKSLKANESNFAEINKVLEEKVNSLMSEVDLILKKQTHVIDMPKRKFDRKRDNSNSKMRVNHSVAQFDSKDAGSCELINIKSARKDSNENDQEVFDNDEINSISSYRNIAQNAQSHSIKTAKSASEAIISFLKGQVTKLQTDLHSMQYEKNKMEEKCKDLEAQILKQEQSKEKLLNQQNHYKDNISKMESANSDMCSKMQAQNAQIISLQKEIEALKKKLTSLNKLLTNNELRLNRNIDENDKLRSSLKISQIEEKESREYIRKIQEEKRLALKFSEKQRTDIHEAFKKQMQLVNNLKKQKLYLEINKEMQFMEREFKKILELNVD